jgi:hypothetical protein
MPHLLATISNDYFTAKLLFFTIFYSKRVAPGKRGVWEQSGKRGPQQQCGTDTAKSPT